MTDKAYERASQIKTDLCRLKLLKKELKKCVRIDIQVSHLECIRQPFIDVVNSVIAQLEQEYENL
jgi:hypothetical protein